MTSTIAVPSGTRIPNWRMPGSTTLGPSEQHTRQIKSLYDNVATPEVPPVIDDDERF